MIDADSSAVGGYEIDPNGLAPKISEIVIGSGVQEYAERIYELAQRRAANLDAQFPSLKEELEEIARMASRIIVLDEGNRIYREAT